MSTRTLGGRVRVPTTTGARRLMIAAMTAAERLLEGPRGRTLLAAAGLALAGLVIRHAWWTAAPLSAGDWRWWDRGRLVQWFPGPTVWDPTLGFAGQNRFEDTF